LEKNPSSASEPRRGVGGSEGGGGGEPSGCWRGGYFRKDRARLVLEPPQIIALKIFEVK
jgi:hypothetical protein